MLCNAGKERGQLCNMRPSINMGFMVKLHCMMLSVVSTKGGRSSTVGLLIQLASMLRLHSGCPVHEVLQGGWQRVSGVIGGQLLLVQVSKHGLGGHLCSCASVAGDCNGHCSSCGTDVYGASACLCPAFHHSNIARPGWAVHVIAERTEPCMLFSSPNLLQLQSWYHQKGQGLSSNTCIATVGCNLLANTTCAPLTSSWQRQSAGDAPICP